MLFKNTICQFREVGTGFKGLSALSEHKIQRMFVVLPRLRKSRAMQRLIVQRTQMMLYDT